MYGTFKDWYKSSYTSNCTASKTEFRDYFEKFYKGRFTVNRVSGLRYVTDEDEDIVVVVGK